MKVAVLANGKEHNDVGTILRVKGKINKAEMILVL